MEKSKERKVIIPTQDIVADYKAREESEVYQPLDNRLKKYHAILLSSVLENRFDDFFEVTLSLIKQSGDILGVKSMSEMADNDDAYDELRKVRTLAKYLKAFKAMPEIPKGKNGDEDEVETPTGDHLYLKFDGKEPYVVLPGEEGLTGKEKLIRIPKEYKKFDQLEFNQERYEFNLSTKTAKLICKIIEKVILDNGKQDEPKPEKESQGKKKYYSGSEMILYQYYKALAGE
jgi:hypothetical protein